MFKSGYGLFSCENGYDCIVDFIISALALATLWFFIQAYKTIVRDKAQVLDKVDRSIFYVAFLHSCLLALQNTLYTNPTIYYLLRLLFLVQSILVISVVAYIAYPEKHQSTIANAMKIGFFISTVIWFAAIMAKVDENFNNECNKAIMIVFSLVSTLLGLLIGYIGYPAIHFIKEEQLKISKTDSDSLWAVRRNKELEQVKEQIQVFVAVTLVASLVQLLWDIKKYSSEYTQLQCDRLTVAYSFVSMITYTIMHLICNLSPSWGIYYLYYWKNKENFQVKENNENDDVNTNSDFDELRSNLISINSK